MNTEKANTEPMEVNSDSDSSSSDDAEERALTHRADELERQISDNKYFYNAHEELVQIYRKLGDLKSMRSAYERFHELFPLTPEIWLSWINDEKKLAESEAQKKHVFALFDKAVEDYLSVNLWVEYAQYSIGASDLSVTRSILERGLQAAGLHAADGSLLWDTLRELEFAHFALAEEGTEQWKEQLTKVVEVFRRQLSVPLLEMDATYTEWQEWLKQLPEGHGVSTDAVEWGYKKAAKIMEGYKPFEKRLQRATEDGELEVIYNEYIKSLSDPSTVCCVYERAVAKLCLNANVWSEYCMYALKLSDPADKISARALRNCPWSEDLWIGRLRILEHLKREEKDVMAGFEQGISSMGAGQGTELWLSYLEYTLRTSQDKDKIYKLFEQAREQLKYKDSIGHVKVSKFYARILAKNGDLQGTRRVWKEILKNPQNKTMASVWLELVNLERQYGDTNTLRSLFQRAIATNTDWPQYIADEWLMFERESGSLEDVIKCARKCTELVKVKPPQEQPQDNKRKLQNDHNKQDTKRPKFEKLEPVKKTPIVKDPTKTVFISNLYPSINEKRLKKIFPNAVNIEIVLDRQGKSRCYGYVQFTIEEEVMTALARDRELLDGRPLFISNCKPDRNERKSAFRYSSQVEENKLFVRGLPVDKSESDLETIFKPFGAKSVRLVRQKSGQPKGLAYIEFEDGATAKKALEKTDQMKIGEHTITVAISAPPPKKQSIVAEPARHSRSKLQVPMIPRAVQVKPEDKAGNGEAKNVKAMSNNDFRKMLFEK